MNPPWPGDDEKFNRTCHARWRERLNREAHGEQCGGCVFWVALHGRLGQDYGACTSAHSIFDGLVRFEHDGCTAFADRGDGSFG
ncbi:DUF3027 domain-containing protein [Amycolatopsis sp. WAC 04182]|uniref:DUF3027 domain-containing protein n=1 Tax=Amycolatopsis sp. WAC 04182 TaxID=2203198 RepID=UPI000F780CA1|nr:DUF3027 domain-containing protein [Amycolatopsis sp. WAC 04182]RSN57302.1 DUF3027 domain-containing protein [Amycolatopsis sp. WAC 04182]